MSTSPSGSTRALAGRAILITGAGAGLGRGYALACADAGASIAVNDVNLEAAQETVDAITAAGGRAIAVGGSVADWDAAKRAVDTCVDAFGTIDGLVANAAIMHMEQPWAEDERRLRAIVDVNVLGVQFIGRHALAAMVESGRGGAIVNVISGALYGIRGMSAYGATKGAVHSMTLNWAIEGAEHGIRVNAISPWAMTKMTADHIDRSKADPSSFPEPDEIAPVVVALLSDATRGVNGELVRFDGRQLSVYEHATVPLVRRDDWSPEDAIAALRERAMVAAAEH